MARKTTGRRTAGPKAELVLAGGAKPRMQKAQSRDWTKAKEEIYINALAETCNFTRAAEAAGISTSSAWRRRKTNARFSLRAACHLLKWKLSFPPQQLPPAVSRGWGPD